MATIFKYNNKLYQAINLDKKLKRLKISKEDIEILLDKNISASELEKEYLKYSNAVKEVPSESWHNPKLYYFINKETGYSITSIHPDCNEQGYEQTTLEHLETLWRKARKIQ